MNGEKSKKVQFKIYIDPEIFERVEMLDAILNKHRRNNRHGVLMDNISMSEYWEGVIKEHLNQPNNLDLLGLSKRNFEIDSSEFD